MGVGGIASPKFPFRSRSLSPSLSLSLWAWFYQRGVKLAVGFIYSALKSILCVIKKNHNKTEKIVAGKGSGKDKINTKCKNNGQNLFLTDVIAAYEIGMATWGCAESRKLRWLRRRPFEVLQAKENERFILEKGTEDGKEKGKAGEAETDRE